MEQTIDLDERKVVGITARLWAFMRIEAGKNNQTINDYLMEKLNVPPDWVPTEPIPETDKQRNLIAARAVRAARHAERVARGETTNGLRHIKLHEQLAPSPVHLVAPAILEVLQQSGGSEMANKVIATVVERIGGQFGPGWNESRMANNGQVVSRLQRLVQSQFTRLLQEGKASRPVKGLWVLAGH